MNKEVNENINYLGDAVAYIHAAVQLDPPPGSPTPLRLLVLDVRNSSSGTASGTLNVYTQNVCS